MNDSTISAIATATAQTSLAQTFDLWRPIGTLFIFLITSGILFALIKLIFILGKQKQSFDNLEKSVNKLNPAVTRLNSCVQEIQTIMKNKYSSLTLMQETLDVYGIANSPIVLKDEYRTFIQESGIASQIEERKSQIIEAVNLKKPATGLDAQNVILDLILNENIETILDTLEYKKLLFQNGKSSKDYVMILAVYLFEIIIPEVITE